jgi:hypothetical protein
MTLYYLYQEGVEACSKEPLKVQLDGRVIGEIRKVEGGYQYFPKGQKTGGEIFKSVTEVQSSLEFDEDQFDAVDDIRDY